MRDFRDIFDYQKDPRGTFNSISASWYSIQLCPNNIPMISFQKGQKGCQPSHPSPLPPRPTRIPGTSAWAPRCWWRGRGDLTHVACFATSPLTGGWPWGHGMLHLGWKHGTDNGPKKGKGYIGLNENMALAWSCLGTCWGSRWPSQGPEFRTGATKSFWHFVSQLKMIFDGHVWASRISDTSCKDAFVIICWLK